MNVVAKELSSVQQFVKFMILSNSCTDIRNLSRPQSIEMRQKDKTKLVTENRQKQ